MKRLLKSYQGFNVGDKIVDKYGNATTIKAFARIRNNVITRAIYGRNKGAEIGDVLALTKIHTSLFRFEHDGRTISTWSIDAIGYNTSNLVGCDDDVRDIYIFTSLNHMNLYGGGYTEIEILRESIIDDYRNRGGRI